MKPLEIEAKKLADILRDPYYNPIRNVEATIKLFKNVNQVIEDIDHAYNYKIHQK